LARNQVNVYVTCSHHVLMKKCSHHDKAEIAHLTLNSNHSKASWNVIMYQCMQCTPVMVS